MSQEMMQAVVVHAPKDYRVETIPRPRPGAGDVIIKVDASGICASDMKCFSGSSMFWSENGAVQVPVVPGHEFAGTVVELGEAAAELHGVKLGDRVLAEQIIPCGTCRMCRGGHYWMCQPHAIFGFTGWQSNGGMSEYMLLPKRSLIHVIDPAIPVREGAYIEPLACAIHAVERGDIAPGDTVVVAGVGNIGLCMLQAARRFNPGQLIAIDTKPYRLELALRLGADVVINPLEQDAPALVRKLTEGYGCDVYIEATGSGLGPQQGLNMIRRMGTVVAFSVMSDPVTIDWNLIGDQRELNIHGSHLGPYCYPKAIAAIADGSINVKPLITAEYPLSRFAEAMDTARAGDNLKTLIIP